MSQWSESVGNITIVTPQSLHLSADRITVSVLGCGKSEGKPWIEPVSNLIQNTWPDDSFTFYKQDVELTDEILPWVDHYAGKSSFTLIHLGFPGSSNLLAIASRLAGRSNVWISMDSAHPASTRQLLNSWSHNAILTTPSEQVLKMVEKRYLEIH